MHTKTSREEWQKRVERWRDSGLTAQQFASELGINPATLKFWAYRLQRTNQHTEASAYSAKAKSPSPSSFIEVRAEPEASSFEIELANGRRLRVPARFESNALERLLAVLERA